MALFYCYHIACNLQGSWEEEIIKNSHMGIIGARFSIKAETRGKQRE